MGTIEITDPAMSTGKFVKYCPFRVARPAEIERVSAVELTINGHMSSFHAKRVVNIPRAESPDFERGRNIL